jgi:hypothetical protein
MSVEEKAETAKSLPDIGLPGPGGQSGRNSVLYFMRFTLRFAPISRLCAAKLE